MSQNSHIQIMSWNSLPKWLQLKQRSQRAIVENKMLPKFLLSHRTKTVPMGGGGEHFHETSSSNDLSRGVEDYAQQE
jgi:hypothetical protein